MRKMLMALFVLLLLPIVGICAQNVMDTIPKVVEQNDIEVKIDMNELNALQTEKDNAIKAYSALNSKYEAVLARLSIDSIKTASSLTQLSKTEMENMHLKEEIGQLREKLFKSDKCLVSTASNFLYIPYEAYSINNIAIRAFETIDSDSLRQKHIIKFRLLTNYQQDIKALLSFLEKMEAELNKPFVKNAVGELQILQTEGYYVLYHEYEDWANTYLGGHLMNIEGQLKAFDGKTHKVNFGDIINELQNCIKTVEEL